MPTIHMRLLVGIAHLRVFQKSNRSPIRGYREFRQQLNIDHIK